MEKFEAMPIWRGTGGGTLGEKSPAAEKSGVRGTFNEKKKKKKKKKWLGGNNKCMCAALIL